MVRIRFRTALALCALLASASLHAQQLRGVIRGTVKSKDGAVLPGATVTINSPSYIIKNATTTTNDRGEYRFPLLDPGIYEVKVELHGFATGSTTGIRLLLGQSLDIPVILEPEGVSKTITVESSPVVDKRASQLGTNFTQEVLQNIPSGRSVNSVLKFTPGSSEDTADSGIVTVNGASVRGNALQVDGVDVTDPTVGTQLAGLNFDNIEEIQVETAGHSAEYGQFAGAVVNSVTKSGGNKLSGEGNIYYEGKSLTSKNGQDIKNTFGLTPNQIKKFIDTQGQLGGPVIKDKIWFFGSYGYQDRDDVVSGFPELSNRNTNLGFAKLTWQPTPKNKVVGFVNYDSLDRDNRGAGSLVPPESTRSQTGHGWTPQFEYTGTFNPTTYVQGRAAFVDENFDLIPKNGEPAHFNLDTGRQEVSDGRLDINKRKRKQFVGSLSHYQDNFLGGNHDFKFGFEYENSSEFRDFTAQQGLFYYDTGGAGAASIPTYVYTVQDPAERDAIHRASFYAQDSWTIKNRLTVNAGVRFDKNKSLFPTQTGANGQTIAAVNDVADFSDWSPRIGLAFDPTGDGKSAIRAAYSRIVGANITQYFSGINPNAISGQLHIVCGGPADQGVCAPGQKFSDVLAEFGASTTTIDPNFGTPLTDEYSVGVEREVFSNFSFGANYIERREKRLPETVELRQFAPRTTTIRGDERVNDQNQVVETIPDKQITVFDPITDSQQIITNPSIAKREYRAFELIVSKRMSNKWQMMSSFVVSRSAGLLGTDFNDSSSISGIFGSPNNLINAFGNLQLSRPYAFKINGTYQGPWGVNLGGFYQFISGTPYTRTARVAVVNSQPVTIFAEPRGSHRLDPIHELNMRVEKEFRLGPARLSGILDVFNLLNIDTPVDVRTRTVGDPSTAAASNRFGAPLDLFDPRTVRLAARLIW